ncbi:GNAT family N-acetyltransferase [Thalassobaculum sp. OXR-137]|uniref:GNAT family N-acetyltransferase n=1 Tax=Thalassobaculum sp. OXR-137 TaxID=3100173 RepID=UPI002AC8E30F|nr:GNAT family N-acetyltransferase [Thalassobaculum sp. OXR-137]WPZ35192.1 GNAT family N-acetyltransferase [Thalassobaculum sp. OXR-137]
MSGQVTVRAMTLSDVPRCVTLLNQLGYAMDAEVLADRLRVVQDSPGHAVMVSVFGEEVVGVLHVFQRPAIEKPTEAVVQSLVIDETRRGLGLGRRLMAAAESWAREHGLSSVSLASHERRTDAHAFYTALGYENTDTSKFFRRTLGPC